MLHVVETDPETAAMDFHADAVATAAMAVKRARETIIKAERQALVDLALTPSQLEVMRAIARAGEPVKSMAIASAMTCRVPDITRLLDRVERAGLITRTRSVVDRRAVLIDLTTAGAQLLDVAEEAVSEALVELFGGVEAEYIEVLGDVLPGIGADAP